MAHPFIHSCPSEVRFVMITFMGPYLSVQLLEVKARGTKRREEILFVEFTDPARKPVNRVQWWRNV